MRSHCQRLDEWMRQRLRMCIWKQWKKIKCRHDNLVSLGIGHFKAWEYANTRKSYWHTSNSPILACSLPNAYFTAQGLLCFTEVYNKTLNLQTAVCRTARSSRSGRLLSLSPLRTVHETFTSHFSSTLKATLEARKSFYY